MNYLERAADQLALVAHQWPAHWHVHTWAHTPHVCTPFYPGAVRQGQALKHALTCMSQQPLSTQPLSSNLCHNEYNVPPYVSKIHSIYAFRNNNNNVVEVSFLVLF